MVLYLIALLIGLLFVWLGASCLCCRFDAFWFGRWLCFVGFLGAWVRVLLLFEFGAWVRVLRFVGLCGYCGFGVVS